MRAANSMYHEMAAYRVVWYSFLSIYHRALSIYHLHFHPHNISSVLPPLSLILLTGLRVYTQSSPDYQYGPWL